MTYICTHCLSEIEVESIIPKIAEMLFKATDPEQAITEKVIAELLTLKGLYVKPEKVRLMISHIRIHNIVPYLVSGVKGYYVADDSLEVEDQVLRLRLTAGAALQEAAALEQQLNEIIH